MDKRLISEIALKCDDIELKDFHEGIYEKCLLRASRIVARRYSIIQRVVSFDAKISIPEGEDETTWVDQEKKKAFPIPVPSFVAESKVIVNEIDYLKVGKIDTTTLGTISADIEEYEDQDSKLLLAEDYQYLIYRDQSQYYLNYSPRTKSDSIELWYTSDINEDDFDVEELRPMIPTQYTEELLSYGVVEVSKLGIAKFNTSPAKVSKYKNLIQLYGIDENVLNNQLHTNDDWINIKPHWAV